MPAKIEENHIYYSADRPTAQTMLEVREEPFKKGLW